MPLPLPLQRRDWTRRIRALDASIGARVLQAYARHIASMERAAAVAASNAGAERGEGLLAGQRATAEAQRLREAIEREIRTFTPALSAAARDGVTQGIEAGQAVALGMIGTQTGATLNTLNSFGVSQMIGIVDSEPFRAALNRFGPAAGQKAADILLTGIAAGMGPARIAKRLRDFVVGEMRQWAETTARTAMLTSFRRASHETYRANADVVGSWMWWAALDSRTCFPAGTRITTEYGNLPIEYVRVGDRVQTNSGKYQRVTDTMKRQYDGEAVTVTVAGKTLTMTADHPVLIERGGIRHWVSARDCQTGDSVFLNVQELPDDGYHFNGDIAVKSGGGDAQSTIALLDQPSNLPGIPRAVLMPIRFINLNRKISRRNKEIDRVLGKRGLLLEHFAQRLKTQAKIALRFGLSVIASIAARGAKLSVCATRTNAERLTASEASIDNGRPAACFTTIKTFIAVLCERLSAAFTLDIHSCGSFALNAAHVESTSIRSRNGELLAADGACFGDTVALNGLITSPATEPARPRPLVLEGLAADFTRRVNTLILSRPVASGATVLPAALFSPSFGDAELFPTVVADSFSHSIIISNVAHHIQCEVFDLSVENDHTFFANGVLVHNCLSCISQHGSVHPLSEELTDHHRGRCSPIPVVRGTTWASSVQRGEQWFDRQSAGVQREMLGPSAYAAYRRGEWDWSRVSVEYQDAVYGAMRRAATLGEMGVERIR